MFHNRITGSRGQHKLECSRVKEISRVGWNEISFWPTPWSFQGQKSKLITDYDLGDGSR